MTNIESIESNLATTCDEDLYERVAPELIRFATALVGRVDAPDILSNAVVKSLAAPGWAAVTNKRAYLYRAVVNEARTWQRRAGQRRAREATTGAGPHWDMPNLRPDVRKAVAELSVRQRAVITMTYWADLPADAIGELLGISEGAVRRHLARARANLRRTLDV